MVPGPSEYRAALRTPVYLFRAHNTRSLPSRPPWRSLRPWPATCSSCPGPGLSLEIVSRSDSTLRGHVVAEVRAIDAVRREQTGKGYDAVLFVPSFLEAGRVTANDVHMARVGGAFVPWARPSSPGRSFGYRSSNLKEFLVEKSGGALSTGDVHSVSLEDIRLGGPQRVASVLAHALPERLS